jgi:hypothetical protein
MNIRKAEHFLRLLLARDTTKTQALGLLRTINRSQLDCLVEIAHNLVFNPEVAIDYVRKRRKLFEALAGKKQRHIVQHHPLVILRALLQSRKVLLEALRAS